MADIFDYLKKRGFLSLREDSFNEVDNLVLAMLAYADFDGILEDSFKTVSISTADRKYFEKHSRAEAKKSNACGRTARSRSIVISNNSNT